MYIVPKRMIRKPGTQESMKMFYLHYPLKINRGSKCIISNLKIISRIAFYYTIIATDSY
jgi:hypothetical protein